MSKSEQQQSGEPERGPEGAVRPSLPHDAVPKEGDKGTVQYQARAEEDTREQRAASLATAAEYAAAALIVLDENRKNRQKGPSYKREKGAPQRTELTAAQTTEVHSRGHLKLGQSVDRGLVAAVRGLFADTDTMGPLILLDSLDRSS